MPAFVTTPDDPHWWYRGGAYDVGGAAGEVLTELSADALRWLWDNAVRDRPDRRGIGSITVPVVPVVGEPELPGPVGVIPPDPVPPAPAAVAVGVIEADDQSERDP